MNTGPGRDVIKQDVGCYIRQIPQDVYFRGRVTLVFNVLISRHFILFRLILISKCSGYTMKSVRRYNTLNKACTEEALTRSGTASLRINEKNFPHG